MPFEARRRMLADLSLLTPGCDFLRVADPLAIQCEIMPRMRDYKARETKTFQAHYYPEIDRNRRDSSSNTGRSGRQMTAG
jgi:hypothetical protein